jgi:hypothetical protein
MVGMVLFCEHFRFYGLEKGDAAVEGRGVKFEPRIFVRVGMNAANQKAQIPYKRVPLIFG